MTRRQVEAARRLAAKNPVFHEFLTHSNRQLTELLASLGTFAEE
ncbi:hypothetical protein [Herbidospora galbida]|nr:hypothetical protein [Herbidospora galbida]